MKVNKTFYIVAGVIIITIVFVAYNFLLAYASYANDIPRKIRHINRFIATIFIFGTGYYAFKKYDVKWLSKIWTICYFTVIILLVLAGLCDWAFGPISAQIRTIAKNLNEFLISPLPFVALYAMSRKFGKIDTNLPVNS